MPRGLALLLLSVLCACKGRIDRDLTCGNGTRGPDEECDDGNDVAGDGCSPDCFEEECQNARLDPGEQCDDGNGVNGDGCASDCTHERCGDGVRDPLEACDDANGAVGDGCRPDCTIEMCGDGIDDLLEQCDDMNDVAGDGCRPDCTTEVCGDGTRDPQEVCDDENVVGGDGCRADCTAEICGDGTLDPQEGCDDTNVVGGDGCSATCVSELCGNNILDPIEVCDDNNVMSGDGCRGDCRGLEICGDGLLDVMEECDDMNTDDADGCEGDCTRPACGNGIVDPGEICLPTAASSTHTVGGMPGRIAVGRLDADDSDWDLVVPSGMADNVTILFGVGNGTFTAVNYAAGDGSLSVTLGDLDNDGDVDLATSDGTVGTVTVLYNFFDQFDSTRQTVSLPQPPRPAVVAANLDGDAALEIAVAGEGGVRILNRGSDNLYSIATTIAMSDAPVAIAAGRIDGDGDVDLVVARPDASPPRTTVLRNDGSAMFPSGMAIDTNDTAGPVDVILANIDGDGDLDIITANLGSDNVTVQGNDGTGAAASLVRFSVGDGPEAVFAADYDNDGDLDLATINQNQAGYTILAGNGAGVFTMALQRALCSGQSLAAGDFDNDGAVDVAMVCNNVRILVANP